MSSDDWSLAICLPFQVICLALVIYFNWKANRSWKEAERAWEQTCESWRQADRDWARAEANWRRVEEMTTHRPL